MFIINIVQQQRKACAFTQEELAKKIGVSRRTIISLETGNYTPSLLLAFQLSEALDTPIDKLFQLDKEKEIQS